MILGFDIGGTKCAVITAEINKGEIEITAKEILPTDLKIKPCEMIDRLIAAADKICGGKSVEKIGVSCGGPLDSKAGVILGPPNLPGWDNVPVVKILKEHYGAPTQLQNDANACAVAEWKFGAGKGFDNIIFLTFGTGLGAGLILDGKLYSGTNGNAGEVGHIRLCESGPVGYGKSGSFEGFCSGGGIAQLGFTLALEKAKQGENPLYFKEGMKREEITAKSIAEAAKKGDKTALEVYKICGEHLGKGLSVLIDVLNPERIIIGSIFARSKELLWRYADEVIKKEALKGSAECCEVVAAQLGEQIGDYAAVATALI
ncbi:MAG: ROK family protein [Clostridia bacterium]|nr:ROK family protein [Clostridia bacterium]